MQMQRETSTTPSLIALDTRTRPGELPAVYEDDDDEMDEMDEIDEIEEIKNADHKFGHYEVDEFFRDGADDLYKAMSKEDTDTTKVRSALKDILKMHESSAQFAGRREYKEAMATYLREVPKVREEMKSFLNALDKGMEYLQREDKSGFEEAERDRGGAGR